MWNGSGRLLILKGLRSAEIRELRSSEVDMAARTITTPGASTKSRVTHIADLGEPAPDGLRAMQGLRFAP